MICQKVLFGELEEHAAEFHPIMVGRVFACFEFFVGKFVFDVLFTVLSFEDLGDVLFDILGHD